MTVPEWQRQIEGIMLYANGEKYGQPELRALLDALWLEAYEEGKAGVFDA